MAITDLIGGFVPDSPVTSFGSPMHHIFDRPAAQFRSLLPTAVIAVGVALAAPASAQVTVDLSYQGRLEIDAVAETTTLSLRLGLFAPGDDTSCLADAALAPTCGDFSREIPGVALQAGNFTAVLESVPVAAVSPPADLAVAVERPDGTFVFLGRQLLRDVPSSGHARLAEDGPFAPPIGSIVAWHPVITGQTTNDLPPNWVPCSGQVLADVDSPINGAVIPNLNGTGRFLRGANTSGTLQNDQLQQHSHVDSGHTHPFRRPRWFANETPNGNSMFTSQDTAANNQGSNTQGGNANLGGATTFGNGTPRVGAETRPTNMSVVWIMRVR